MPLIVTGLERALALAETMEARGFGGRDQRDAWRSGALYAGIIGLLTLSIVNVFIALPAFLLCPMLVCLGSLSWLGVRRKKRQAARRVRWAAAAWCIALGPLAALGVVLLSERALLVYDVYAMAWAGLPPFDPWIAIALFGIATPGLVMRSSRLRNGDPA
jgi:cytochrome bd-type quinol oxidase subunit 2